MKTTTAFSALARRREERSREGLRFLVRSLNKDGTPSRAPLTDADWRLNAFATEDGAEARRLQLEALNPGRRFAVVPAP